MTLITWSWIFLVLYIGLMLVIGVIASRRVKHADDFATARGSYGPVFLAFAFAASTASGATFLGSPALSYEWGLAANWSNFLYPIGLYFGVLIACAWLPHRATALAIGPFLSTWAIGISPRGFGCWSL